MIMIMQYFLHGFQERFNQNNNQHFTRTGGIASRFVYPQTYAQSLMLRTDVEHVGAQMLRSLSSNSASISSNQNHLVKQAILTPKAAWLKYAA